MPAAAARPRGMRLPACLHASAVHAAAHCAGDMRCLSAALLLLVLAGSVNAEGKAWRARCLHVQGASCSTCGPSPAALPALCRLCTARHSWRPPILERSVRGRRAECKKRNQTLAAHSGGSIQHDACPSRLRWLQPLNFLQLISDYASEVSSITHPKSAEGDGVDDFGVPYSTMGNIYLNGT